MASHGVILETAPGNDASKPMITIPGPGGYKIEWMPGAIRIPMEIAPSGHPVIPCDNFKNGSSSADDMGITLHANLSGSGASSSSNPNE